MEDGLVDALKGRVVACDGPGLAMEKGAVHEIESLGGSGGGGSFHEGFLGAGEVEGTHDGGEEAATDFSVDSTTWVVRWLVEFERGAADLVAEASADMEGGVAPGFEVFSLAIAPCVVVVGRIAFVCAEAGALPCLGDYDVADEGLGGPGVFLKEECEVVEECALEGFGSLGAKVTGRIDEGRAGEVHPDPVCPNAGGEGIAVVGEAVCEFESSGTLSEVFVLFAEEAQECAWDGVALGPGVPAFVNARVEGLGLFLHDHGPWNGVRRGGLEFGDGTDELPEFQALGLVDLVVDLSGEVEVEIVARRFIFRNAVFDVVVDDLCFFFKFGTVGNGGGVLRGFGNDREFPRDAGAVENSVESVVVCGRDGIGFVIVAAGTGDGHSHGGAGGNVNAVSNDEVVLTALIGAADGEESEGGKFLAGKIHEVRCDLAMKELVVRKGLIEGSNDPVAIGVGVRIVFVFGTCGALGVGVAGDIEPMTGPALSEGRACEEIIGEVTKPAGARVGEPL